MVIVKVGFLVSYDYEFIKLALPRVYDHVSEIFFAVDVEGVTWSGESFLIADEFWKWLKAFDIENKIAIYRDQFYVPGMSAMECETRERNMLAKQMGTADWYIQIDSDEYFIDFGFFVEKLRRLRPEGPTTVTCRVLTLFKELSEGFLFIDESEETLNFATNSPIYLVARNNAPEYTYIHWNDLVLHQSWARSADDIYKKLNNWGHKNDFNVTSFYKLWDAIDKDNYYVLHHFHPLNPVLWPKLGLLKGEIDDILDDEYIRDIGLKRNLKKSRKSFFSRIWKKIRGR